MIPEVFAGLFVLYVWGADFGPVRVMTWTVTERNHEECQRAVVYLQQKGYSAECGEEL